MDWLSDMAWLVGQWFALLTLSALVGLAIGWFAWRRQPATAQPRVDIDLTQPVTATGNHPATGQEVVDLAALTSERDSLRSQRDRLRAQLSEIEVMVGDEESRLRSTDTLETD